MASLPTFWSPTQKEVNADLESPCEDVCVPSPPEKEEQVWMTDPTFFWPKMARFRQFVTHNGLTYSFFF